MNEMTKDTILYTIIEGLHKNPNESWQSYVDRYNIYKTIEAENKIPNWAKKRANIILLKEKRKLSKIERIENEENIRETERFNDNEDNIKKERRRRWKLNKKIEEDENKEIEKAIKDLYKDIIKLDENNDLLIQLFENHENNNLNQTKKSKNILIEDKENIPPETIIKIKNEINHSKLKSKCPLDKWINK
jgi:hypothetical protein